MRVGKRVRGGVYLHRSACHNLSRADRERVEAACRATEADWNVVRVSSGEISLLHYPRFEDEAFPALTGSVLVRDGMEAKHADYSGRRNPPVLHRKELLVDFDHPLRPDWAETTRRLIVAGAFVEPHRVGTREAWERRLRGLGLSSEGRTEP